MGTYRFVCQCGETFDGESMDSLKVKLVLHDCPLHKKSFWGKILSFIKKLLTGL